MRGCRGLVAVVVAMVLAVVSAPSGASYAATPWVEKAQRRLNELGCDAGRADGVVDEHLRAGVLRFQSANRLPQNARLDATTRERLYGVRARRCDLRKVPLRSGTGRRIVLSQRQNWLWLVRADGTLVAQGGIVDNDWLPQRTYYTGAQCGRPGRVEYNRDLSGTLGLYYFVRYAECTVGFHQIPVYLSTGRQIHPDWYVGTNLQESRGCTRMARPLARAVWRFTVSRTKVVVVWG